MTAINTDANLLELPGSVSVSVNTFEPSTWDHDVVFDEATNDRPSTITTQALPTYYIQVHDDLNNRITYHDGNDAGDVAGVADTANDDAYSMTGFTVSNATYNANGILDLKLPTSTGQTLKVANVNVKDGATDLAADFELTVTAGHAADGSITASAAWSGSSQTRTQEDLAGKAQYAFWNINDSARIGSNTTAAGSEFSTDGLDADNLTAEVTTTNIDTYYNDEKTAVVNGLNGQSGFSAWSITFNTIARDTDNALSNYGRNSGRAGNESLFVNGDRVITSGSTSYVISVEGLDSATMTLANDQGNGVYGIVKQNDDLIAV